tara:strand:- start:15591 stop:16184 length:594 start_codon:yes stop_codon:yes gene_type:complete
MAKKLTLVKKLKKEIKKEQKKKKLEAQKILEKAFLLANKKSKINAKKKITKVKAPKEKGPVKYASVHLKLVKGKIVKLLDNSDSPSDPKWNWTKQIKPAPKKAVLGATSPFKPSRCADYSIGALRKYAESAKIPMFLKMDRIELCKALFMKSFKARTCMKDQKYGVLRHYAALSKFKNPNASKDILCKTFTLKKYKK